MKACCDCKHVHVIVDEGVNGHSLYAKCHHPKSFIEIRSFYDGITKTAVHSIDTMRMLGSCGPTGTLFEPKD